MKLSPLLASAIAACVFAVGQPRVANADDTEIFLPSATSASVQPNILFIMDTSGSMDTLVDIRTPYDPAGVYTGSCDENRIYWRRAGSDYDVPSCGWWSDTRDQWVSKSNNFCNRAADFLAATGTTPPIGPLKQWDGDSNNENKRKWRDLQEDEDDAIECQADMESHHGKIAGDYLVPANQGVGPWSSTQADEIDWGDPKSYILYTGHYLNWFHDSSERTTKTRMKIVKETAVSTVEGLKNVNVGLMRFSSTNEGGMVTHQIAPISSARTELVSQLNAMSEGGGTPLSETFFEAYQYLTGGNVEFGEDSEPSESVSASRTSMDGGKYIKPSYQACQQNIVVYLTDGDPTVDGSAHSDIESVIGKSCTENGAVGNEGGGANAGDGKCLDDLAGYMANRDFYDDPLVTGTATDPEPVENIRTYTIGFGTGVTERGLALLKKTAELGQGEFFEATDPESLKEVLDNIIGDLQDQSVSFTSPTVSVNAFNRTQTLNDLFITVFQPETKVHWPGNLKKYRLRPDGTIMDATQPTNVPAVDLKTGFFAEDTTSYWSTSPDEFYVPRGGAAHKLPVPGSRDVFTDAGFLADGTKKSLDIAENRVADANTNITATMLGLAASATAAERTALINWVRGADVDDDDGDGVTLAESRFEIGDPLHARPVSVIYGGTASSPDAVVFAATNDGYLHAINAATGVELWSFIPSELLPRAKRLREDPSTSSKSYGLDGNIAVHKIDVDGDGTIENGDQVLLYFGMGRGGSNYYALDVTSKEAPRILWRKGAADELAGLGQSWSTPVITNVRIKSSSTGPVETKLVMIVGGGYDSTQDNTTAAPDSYPLYKTDAIGNRIFMVDAYTGALLWRAGPTSDTSAQLKHASMVNSIPADVRVIDITADGIADRMYAADMGGRVWRFDIHNGLETGSLVKGGVFASLGNPSTAATTAANARRFYNAPDVAAVRANGVSFLSIALGSGYRGHPLNTRINDRFYGLRDYIPFRPMTDAEITAMDADPIVDDDATTGADLVNVTTNPAAVIPVSAKGWKINLSTGEKALAEARTFEGSIVFPTFTPNSSTSTNTCKPQSGINALYAINAINGAPSIDRDGDGTFETGDRASPLEQSGIAPAVVILFPTPEPSCTGAACSPPPKCLVGVESCGVGFNNAPVKTFWNQSSAD